jgi:hypothetical protein
VLYLKKNEVNNLVLTLGYDVSTTLLFTFVHEISVQIFEWTGQDTSDHRERYNLFQLIEGLDIELPRGQYSYSVAGQEGRMVVELATEETTIYD